MVEGLEVVIKYRGAKYNRVASPTTASSEFAILKKDLAHLRVHSPSQKNVRRVNGSFILHWPTAGTSPKLDGLVDSLHTRWFKLCSDDPEALKLREFLSIESITLTQDGVQIRSTAQRDQVSQNAPPGTLRMGDSSSGVAQQPAQVSVPTFLPAKPPPPLLPPPRVPPSAPRSDRIPPHPKRRMSSIDASSNSSTRQKLDMSETQRVSPSLRMINTQAQPTCTPTSPKTDLPQHRSTTPREPPSKPVLQLLREDGVPNLPPSRDSGEMTPLTPLPVTTPVSAPPTSAPGWGSLDWGSEPPPPSPAGPAPASALSATPVPMSLSALSTAPVPMPASGFSVAPAPASTSHNPTGAGDVANLMRELLETRNQLATMQIREQAILDDLERLGAPPVESYQNPTGSGSGTGGGGGKDGKSGAESALRDEVSRLENELKAERASRMRAERALNEVERECRAPFVVPALFQAFMKISELSN